MAIDMENKSFKCDYKMLIYVFSPHSCFSYIFANIPWCTNYIFIEGISFIKISILKEYTQKREENYDSGLFCLVKHQ